MDRSADTAAFAGGSRPDGGGRSGDSSTCNSGCCTNSVNPLPSTAEVRFQLEEKLAEYCERRLSHAFRLWHSEPHVWELGLGSGTTLEFNKADLPADFEDVYDCLICPFRDPTGLVNMDRCPMPADQCIITDYWEERKFLASSIVADNGAFVVVGRIDNTTAQKERVGDTMYHMVMDYKRTSAGREL